MAKYRKVNPQRWNDPRVRTLSKPGPNGLILYWLLRTGPQTGIIPGLYEARAGGLADYLGWPVGDLTASLREGIPQDFAMAFLEISKGIGDAIPGLAKADWQAGLVFVPDAIEDDPPQSVNAATAWGVAWSELPDCELKQEGFQHVLAYLEGIGEAFALAFAKASRIQITDNRLQITDPRLQTTRAAARGGSTEDQEPVARAGPSGKNPRRKVDTGRLAEARGKAASNVARKGAATRKARQVDLPPLPAVEVVFTGDLPEADRQALLDQLDGKHGKDRQQRARKLVCDEVLRVYRAERKRVTGNGFVKMDDRSKAALVELAVGCIGYKFTPEALFRWWQEPGNNWTKMAFPSLGFMATAKNLDRAAAAMGGSGRRRRAAGHGYDDPGKLDPRVREALKCATEVDLSVDAISDAQLVVIQNVAKQLAVGRSPGASGETLKLATLIKPLFEKGAA
jgi:hypothetical protein